MLWFVAVTKNGAVYSLVRRAAICHFVNLGERCSLCF